MVRTAALGVALSSLVSGCTVICPTVGVIRGSMNADVITDERGCMHGPDGTTLVPCTHPGPVRYPRTIIENVLVGALVDAAFLTTLWAIALSESSDTAFRR